MKKKYERPYAEKVEFDYRDSVTACSSFWWFWCCEKQEESNACKTQDTQQQQQAETQQKGNSHWENKSPYYWGC